MSNKVLVIGSINMDLILEVVTPPQTGETVLSQNFSTSPGGKGANQAYAIAKLGGSVGFLGAVGDDSYGHASIQNLHSVGVDVSGIAVLPGANTGVACIIIDKNGDNRIIVSPGANHHITKDFLKSQKEKIAQCDIVVFQLEIPLETVCYGIELAHQLGKKVVLNPAPMMPEFFQDPQLFSKIDLLVPNETELRQLTGAEIDETKQILTAAQTLIEKGVGALYVTLGEKGSMYLDQDQHLFFEPVVVKAIDTTAAGDTYIAAAVLRIAEGNSVEDAGRFATKAAALTVTKLGAQNAIPTMTEIDAFYKNIEEGLQ